MSGSTRPGRCYAACEGIIAAWSVVLLLAMPWINERLGVWIGIEPSGLRHWALAFGVPFVALLPATAAMGATLPAMDQLVCRLRRDGRRLPGVYAVNTCGAMAGTILVTFVAMPRLGYYPALWILIGLNLFCVAGTLLGPARGEAVRPPVDAPGDERPDDRWLGVTLFATGLAGIGYEVLGIRVMGQVLQNTVYSFATALSVYLLGTVVGAAIYQRWLVRRPYQATLAVLLQATAASCVLGIVLLSSSEEIYAGLRRIAGGSLFGSLTGEIGLAVVFLLPSTIMGMTFSHLALAARDRRGGVGRALGLNTFGGAAAPLLFGVVLLPRVGGAIAIAIASGIYLALVPGGFQRRVVSITIGVTAVTAALLIDFRGLVETPDDGRIIQYRNGVMASVAVVERRENPGAPPIRILKVNNRFRMGATGTAFLERRLGHIPVLLHDDPESVLCLGIGTGHTLSAAAAHPGVDVTAVELLPEVVDLLPAFGETNSQVHHATNVDIRVADARRFVQATGDRFDVIIADLFHPARDGSGMLYTLEHFGVIRDRLTEDGLFCQWLPLYQMDAGTLHTIVRTFLEVFPAGSAWLCSYNVHTPALGLIGGPGAATLEPGRVDRRLDSERLRARLTALDLGDELRLFGTFVADAGSLGVVAGSGPVNRDAWPIVMFEAPRFVYAEATHEGHDLLIGLLDALAAETIVRPATGTAFGETVERYVEARDLYLRGACRLASGDLDGGIALFIESERTPSEFRLGKLVTRIEAAKIASTEPDRARTWLTALLETDPDDEETVKMLRRLGRP